MNFSPKVVIEATDINRNQLSYWRRLRLVDPERTVSKRGSKALYTFKDVLKVQILSSLRAFRFSISAMRYIMHIVDSHSLAVLRKKVFISDGLEYYSLHDNNGKLQILKPSVYIIYFDIMISQLEQNLRGEL